MAKTQTNDSQAAELEAKAKAEAEAAEAAKKAEEAAKLKAEAAKKAEDEAKAKADAEAAEAAKKAIAVSVRHTTEYPHYRRAGLVLSQTAIECFVTPEQLAVLEKDTWVEVKKK